MLCYERPTDRVSFAVLLLPESSRCRINYTNFRYPCFASSELSRHSSSSDGRAGNFFIYLTACLLHLIPKDLYLWRAHNANPSYLKFLLRHPLSRQHCLLVVRFSAERLKHLTPADHRRIYTKFQNIRFAYNYYYLQRCKITDREHRGFRPRHIQSTMALHSIEWKLYLVLGL